MKKSLLILSLVCGFIPALMAQVTNPVFFPAFDPFANATSSGGTSYAVGAKLAGQTNALGSSWFGIDTSGPAANAEFLTNTLLVYPGLPPSSGGNSMVLTNAAGPGARIFTGPTTSFFLTGTAANPLHFYYSFVMMVSNLTSLSTNGQYIAAVGNNGTVANQTSQPTSVGGRLYLKQVNGTNYQMGVTSTGAPATSNYDATLFNANQIVFVVVDYEGLANSSVPGTDISRLWVNPDPSTFGAANQPAEAVNGESGSDFGPDISCVQFFNQTGTPNQTLIANYRMGTNWSWVTGGPFINQQLPALTNISGGFTLNVVALNNGSSNTYTWQLNGTNLSNGASFTGSGATVSGATSPSLSITNTSPLDAGTYTVVVANAIGSVTSTPCMGSFYTAPVITVQPSPTNVLFFAGGSNNYSLSFTVLGLPIISNYLYSNSTLVTISTNQSFALNNLQTSANFHVLCSNAQGLATSSVVTVSVLSSPTAPYPHAVLGDRPIGFWPLNEGPDNGAGDNGATAFDYESANDGVYTNVVLNVQGYGPSLATNFGYTPPTDTSTSVAFGTNNVTSNSYVGQIPNINFGATNARSFSVEAWVNMEGVTPPTGAGIVTQGEGALAQFILEYGGGGWEFQVNEVRIVFGSVSATNNTDTFWHHLVGVLDATQGQLIIYVDGMAQNSTAYAASLGIFPSTSPVVIGSRAPKPGADLTNQFNGNIQDVAIYNYALSSLQVSNHYNAAGVPPRVSIPSSTNIDEGTTLRIAATVSGVPPFAYQWFDTTAGMALSGQTNSVLVISSINGTNNGHQFDVTVSNHFGSTTSGLLTLTINSGPPSSVTMTPTSITAYAGQTKAFTVAAVGTEPFSYQWMTNSVVVPGVTGSVYNYLVLLGGPVTITCSVSNSFSAGSPVVVSATVTGVAAPTDAYGLGILGDQPLAYWRLDEPLNASFANDFVGGHNAVYENATNGLPGFRSVDIPSETATGFGMNGITNMSLALEQDVSSTGIPEIDFSTQGANGEFSVEAWVKAPAGQKVGAGIVANGFGNGGEQFCLDTGATGGAFRFFVRNTAGASISVPSTILPDSNWHHLVGVCDQANGAVRFYIDGTAIGMAALSPGAGILARIVNFPVSIGSRSSSSTDGSYLNQLINASMDDVAIYNYPLSSNQVAAHFGLGLAKLAIQYVGSNNTAVISWPPISGFVIQQSSVLSAPNWTSVTNATNVVNGQNQIVVSLTNNTQFYRLSHP